MKRFLKTNLILLLVIAVGVASALVSVGARMRVESNDKTYDIVIDREELLLMADQSEHDEFWWLSRWMKYGIDKVGLWEDSLMTLEKEFGEAVQVMTVADLDKGNPAWRSGLPAEISDRLSELGKEFDEYDVVCLIRRTGSGETDGLSEYILSAFERRYPDVEIFSASDETADYLYLNGNAGDAIYSPTDRINYFDASAMKNTREVVGSVLAYLNLGFREETVAKYTGIGYEIVPRTVSYDGYNGEMFAKDVYET